jgi:hypothetical protein
MLPVLFWGGTSIAMSTLDTYMQFLLSEYEDRIKNYGSRRIKVALWSGMHCGQVSPQSGCNQAT